MLKRFQSCHKIALDLDRSNMRNLLQGVLDIGRGYRCPYCNSELCMGYDAVWCEDCRWEVMYGDIISETDKIRQDIHSFVYKGFGISIDDLNLPRETTLTAILNRMVVIATIRQIKANDSKITIVQEG
jgi:hypothetical protein